MTFLFLFLTGLPLTLQALGSAWLEFSATFLGRGSCSLFSPSFTPFSWSARVMTLLGIGGTVQLNKMHFLKFESVSRSVSQLGFMEKQEPARRWECAFLQVYCLRMINQETEADLTCFRLYFSRRHTPLLEILSQVHRHISKSFIFSWRLTVLVKGTCLLLFNSKRNILICDNIIAVET